MKKKVALLVIDAQHDFCSPNGALPVPGAEEDNNRLSQWILNNKNSIGYIGGCGKNTKLISGQEALSFISMMYSMEICSYSKG